MTAGEKIRSLRKQSGMSQTELGAKLGVKTNAVSKWECERVEDIPMSKIKKMAYLFNVPISYLVDEEHPEPHSNSALQPIPKMRQWPVLGSVACGEPIHREAENDYIAAPEDIDADYVFRCVGDSMNGAHIFDGDLVFIKQGVEVPDGTIGLVRVEDEYMLKRIYHRPDCLQLISDNPAYPPRYITGEQLNAEIVGRAVKFITVAI